MSSTRTATGVYGGLPHIEAAHRAAITTATPRRRAGPWCGTGGSASVGQTRRPLGRRAKSRGSRACRPRPGRSPRPGTTSRSRSEDLMVSWQVWSSALSQDRGTPEHCERGGRTRRYADAESGGATEQWKTKSRLLSHGSVIRNRETSRGSPVARSVCGNVSPAITLSAIAAARSGVHQPSAPREQVRARIRGLGLVPHHVRQCGLDHPPAGGRSVATPNPGSWTGSHAAPPRCPTAAARPTVWRRRSSCRAGSETPAPARRQRSAQCAEPPSLVDDLGRVAAQPHSMLAPRLGSCRRHRPYPTRPARVSACPRARDHARQLRRGPKKATVAVAASMLTAAYFMLRDEKDEHDLGVRDLNDRDNHRITQRLPPASARPRRGGRSGGRLSQHPHHEFSVRRNLVRTRPLVRGGRAP